MSKGATNVEQAVNAFRQCWYLNESAAWAELSAMLPAELDCVIAAAGLVAELAQDALAASPTVQQVASTLPRGV